MKDYIWLKFGKLKEIQYSTEPVREALKRYRESGPRHGSLLLHDDNDAKKAALCYLIDAVAAIGGDIKDEWSGRMMTADKAKRLVLGDEGRAQSLAGKVIARNVLLRWPTPQQTRLPSTRPPNWRPRSARPSRRAAAMRSRPCAR
jgi:hypothetical protein